MIKTIGEKLGAYGFPLVLLFLFTIPLSSFVSVRILIVLLVISFFFPGNKVGFIIHAWDICLYLLVLVVGMTYSEDFRTSTKVLETSFSLLAIPVVFNRLTSVNLQQWRKLFVAFASGVGVACLIVVVHAVIRYADVRQFTVFFSGELTGVIGSHPTYLAYYLIFTISATLFALQFPLSPGKTWMLVFSALFFFLVLLFTGGQTAFISLLLVLSFFLLKFLTEERNSQIWLVFAISSVMVSSIFFVGSLLNLSTDSWDRFVLWESALRATPDFFGVGTGDYKSAIKDYYSLNGLRQFADESFNAHNQYIQLFFSNGLPGLFAFTLLLARPLYLSYKSQSVIGIITFFPFAVYGVTEVFLGRYQGVVFFAVVHQLIVYHYYVMRPSLVVPSMVEKKVLQN